MSDGVIKVLEIEAEVRQIKTLMTDGTYNLILNIPENCRSQVGEMLGWIKCQVHVVIEKTSGPAPTA